MSAGNSRVQVRASTLFVVAGFLLWPGLGIGELFLRAAGLGYEHAYTISTAVGSLVLLLALMCALMYVGVCLCKHRPAWQFLVEAVIAVVLLLFIPAY